MTSKSVMGKRKFVFELVFISRTCIFCLAVVLGGMTFQGRVDDCCRLVMRDGMGQKRSRLIQLLFEHSC
jgi:hypothetical protein